MEGFLTRADRRHAHAARSPHAVESDFSVRKLRIAAVILIGQTFATSILPFMAISLVLIPQTRQFGWSRTDFSFAQTSLFFFGSVSLWPIGRLTDIYGVRRVLIVGTAIVGVVTLAMSLQTGSLAQLYLSYGLLGIFGSTGVAYTKLAAALFTQNRGKALAILGAESTVAYAVVPLLANWLLLSYGWRGMYLVFGAIILAVVPLLYFMLEEPGREQTRSQTHGPSAVRPDGRVFEGMSVAEALRDWVFWLMVIALIAGFPIVGGMAVHMVPALIGKGFSQTRAVEMISLMTAAGLGGTLAGGYFVDRIASAKIATPFSLAAALSGAGLLVVTASVGGLPLLAGAMALGGFSFYGMRPMGTYFHTRFFGLRAFTEIYSVEFMIVNIVTAFAGPLIGAIYDHTHSYRMAFELMVAAPVLSSIVWLALPRYRYAADIGALPPPEP